MNPIQSKTYIGSDRDLYGGMTDTGKIIRDAWVFGIIPETQTCAGWTATRIEALWMRTGQEWEKYGFLVSNLPPQLRERFLRIQAQAVARAKAGGWDPQRELNGDEE